MGKWKRQGVALNERGPTDIADGESFITASGHCLELPTADKAIDSNRNNLVRNDLLEK